MWNTNFDVVLSILLSTTHLVFSEGRLFGGRGGRGPGRGSGGHSPGLNALDENAFPSL